MNRTLLIIVGIVILLILVGLWVYLLFFGTPQDPDEVFSNFGFGPGDDASITVEQNDDSGQPQVDVAQPGLRQLTTRPVAGYQDVRTSTTSPHYAYYGEAGTGHIYRIHMTTGAEERVSGVTIPSAHNIEIAPDASFVVARTGFNNSDDVVFRSLTNQSSTSDSLSVLPGTIIDYKLYADGELLYLAPDTSGSVLKQLDLATLREQTITTLPLTQITMVWGDTPDATHYLYPRPSYYLQGVLYELSNGSLQTTGIRGAGLTAEARGDTIAYSFSAQGRDVESLLRNGDTETSPAFITVIPEKCDFTPLGGGLYCATATEENYRGYPDAWYKGTVSPTDRLYEVNVTTSGSTYLSDLFAESGREIDVTDLSVSHEAPVLFFINKRDNSLWAYDI